MDIINNKNVEIIKKISNNVSNFSLKKAYRKSLYAFHYVKDGNHFLYNTLTREILLLSDSEFEQFNTLIFTDDEFYHYLIDGLFLVVLDFDEYKLATLAKENSIQNQEELNKLHFVSIFTTTACNARCYYCYEKGINTVTMNNKTAVDVGKYLVSHGDKNLRIKWFGGEPFLNSEVITIICNHLKNNSIEYTSEITTNGYLLNNFSKEQFDLWNMKDVHITLDGTAQEYVRIKNYKNNDKNAFSKIIENIHYVQSLGIQVAIRINLTYGMREDIDSLIEFIHNEFDGMNLLSIYISLLYDHYENSAKNLTIAQRKALFEDYKYLNQKLIDYNMSTGELMMGFQTNRCMADSGSATCITPEGNLSVCEHRFEDKIYGTIWGQDDLYNKNMISLFFQRETPSNYCKSCQLYPQCIRLKTCSMDNACTSEYRNYVISTILPRHIQNAYIGYLSDEMLKTQDTHKLVCHWNSPHND